MIYKGNDNYYLSHLIDQARRPAGGIIAGPSYAEAYGTAALAREHLDTPGGDLRRGDDATVRQRHAVSTTARTGTITTSTNPLQIGGDSIYGQYFAGLIDEVRVYNTALTRPQIQADMNTPVGSPLVLKGERIASPAHRHR